MTGGSGEPGSSRAPLITFTVLLVLGCGWLAGVPGRSTWAATDDWRMVGTHDWSLTGLLSDHNQHFSMVPIAIYKALFAVVGFDPFWPYVLITVGLHACVVVAVRMIMVRVGVSAWLATICASALIVVQGASVMVAQFQMTLGLALVLTQFVIAMNGSRRWTLVVGALCGLGAVASSGITLPIVATVFIVAWRRRGLLAAIALTLPAGLVYAAWWITYSPGAPSVFREPPAEWLAKAVWQVTLGLGGLPVSAAVLVLATVAGLIVALVARNTGLRWLEPVLLAGAAGVMLLLAYIGRGYDAPQGVGFARFIYLSAAQVLPLIAAAATVLARRNRWLLALVAAPLLVGVLVNIAGWDAWAHTTNARNEQRKASLAALLASPAGAIAPDWARPYDFSPFEVATDAPWGFLRTLRPEQAGVAGVPISESAANEAILRLRLAKVPNPGSLPSRCVTGSTAVRTHLDNGQLVFVPSMLTPNPPVAMALVRHGATMPGTVLVTPGLEGATLELLGHGKGLTVEFASGLPETPFRVCFQRMPSE